VTALSENVGVIGHDGFSERERPHMGAGIAPAKGEIAGGSGWAIRRPGTCLTSAPPRRGRCSSFGFTRCAPSWLDERVSEVSASDRMATRPVRTRSSEGALGRGNILPLKE
jgi:hypothetical protein